MTETLFATAGPSGQTADVTLSDSAFSNAAPTMTVHAAAPFTATDTFAAVTFPLSFNVDMRILPSTGAAYTLKNGTQQFGPAPEPLSIGVFLVGLVGLGATRSRQLWHFPHRRHAAPLSAPHLVGR